MAYQNIGIPRFYIDWGEWQKNLGVLDTGQMDYVDGDEGDIGEIATLEEMIGIVGLDPFNPLILSVNGLNTKGRVTFTSGAENGAEHTGFPNYIALLNHNFYSSNTKFNIQTSSTGTDNYSIDLESSIINYEDENTSFPDWGGNDGFSIAEIKNNVNPSGSKFLRLAISSGTDPDLGHTFTNDVYIGAISFGRFYDMPHSPELDVTMTIENDGFDAITTQGGTHLTNIRYNGAPMWKRADGSEIPPWTIGEPTTVGRRRGRRVWSMNFKYLSDKDLFASNYMSNTYTENPDGYDSADLDTDADNNEVFYYNLDNDDSFHAQVLNKIGNGQRFIFQPDNTNNNPDQFAICQLDQNSLNIKQVANGVYDISLKIREVW